MLIASAPSCMRPVPSSQSFARGHGGSVACFIWYGWFFRSGCPRESELRHCAGSEELLPLPALTSRASAKYARLACDGYPPIL